MAPRKKKRTPILAMIFMPVILLYAGIILVVSLPYRLSQFIFHIVAGSFRRSRVILVYSDSPKWKAQIETQIIPDLPQNTLIINISKPGLGLSANFDYRQYTYWAGSKEYCPMVILRRPFRKPLLFRFYKAFRKSGGGDSTELQALIQNLHSVLKASPNAA
jgi:hypothetical protein